MNNTIFFFFYNFAHHSNLLDQIIVFLAVYFPYLVVFFAGIFLIFYRKSWKEFFLVFFSAGLAWGVSHLLKILIHILRPFDALPNVHSLFAESGYAFPSGHATFFSALAISIFFYHKKVGYVFMFLALVVSIARIAGGVHFPLDILGGFVLGAAIAFFLKNYKIAR